ncbi:hypothetical protein [Paracoccus suum]|uniref:hypothetical protein n=1 Tax=Paracoccus suum TaxID=2259340 RepID=UPI0013B064F2|nr:hypothetical protein [Paracoccus suum]
MLRLARIRKAHQPEIAELFASIILDRPGFFDGDDAQDLYTPRPVEIAEPGFTFDAAYDPLNRQGADHRGGGRPDGARQEGVSPRCAHAALARSGGDALQHFGSTPVGFGGAWRLGELVFRILFKGDGKRQPQVRSSCGPRASWSFAAPSMRRGR